LEKGSVFTFPRRRRGNTINKRKQRRGTILYVRKESLHITFVYPILTSFSIFNIKPELIAKLGKFFLLKIRALSVIHYAMKLIEFSMVVNLFFSRVYQKFWTWVNCFPRLNIGSNNNGWVLRLCFVFVNINFPFNKFR